MANSPGGAALNSAARIDAANNIYSGFYNYALGQGADTGTAHEFAQIGLGTAYNEGLQASPLWGASGDGGQSIGPFQLYTGGGLGNGLGGNTSPSNQIQVAAAGMWGEPGNSGTYDTGPWNAVGNNYGGSPAYNNDPNAQSLMQSYGASLASKYGLASAAGAGTLADSAGGAASPSYDNTFNALSPAQGNPNAANTSAIGSDPNSVAGAAIPFDQTPMPVNVSSGVGGATVPTAINNQSTVIAAGDTAQAKAIAGGDTAIATTAAKTNAATLGSVSGWLGNVETWFTSLFARFGFILLGLVCLIVGLYMLSKSPEMVNNIKEAAAG